MYELGDSKRPPLLVVLVVMFVGVDSSINEAEHIMDG